MRVLWKFTVVCLLGAPAWGGHAVASEPLTSPGAADSNVIHRGQTSEAASTRISKDWRMVYKNHVYWYWTPQRSWMIWNGTKWVHFLANRPSQKRPLAYQNEQLDRGFYPSEQQVNSAGITGLGYEGLATPEDNATVTQVLTGQRQRGVTYSFPSQQQVNGGGMTGLGYEGLAIPVDVGAGATTQVLTGQGRPSSTYSLPSLPSEVQVHSAGSTGLGYEGLR